MDRGGRSSEVFPGETQLRSLSFRLLQRPFELVPGEVLPDGQL